MSPWLSQHSLAWGEPAAWPTSLSRGTQGERPHGCELTTRLPQARLPPQSTSEARGQSLARDHDTQILSPSVLTTCLGVGGGLPVTSRLPVTHGKAQALLHTHHPGTPCQSCSGPGLRQGGEETPPPKSPAGHLEPVSWPPPCLQQRRNGTAQKLPRARAAPA